MPILYIIVPCYNEEEILYDSANSLKEKLDTLIINNYISKNSKIVFIDDGSKDKTWKIIKDLSETNYSIEGIKLSRNYGHQTALVAGLSTTVNEFDISITIDADLQDDINVIDEMIKKYNSNMYDVIYGVRSNRDSDTAFKRITAESYYKLLHVMGVELVYNHADFRLMSKRAVESLLEFNETNLFLRGIIPRIGYKTTTVEYFRLERKAGKSKYPLKKMIALAWDGITSFSIKPISLIVSVGVILFIIGIVVIFINKLCVTIESLLLLLFGITNISIGIVGEYVGKCYIESKHRPRYFVDFYTNE